MQNTLRRRKPLDILPYGLVMLGLLLIMAAGLNLLLSQESQVMFKVLAEPESGIKPDTFARDARFIDLSHPLFKKPPHAPDDIPIAGIHLHRPGHPFHVHQNHVAAPVGDQVRHLAVVPQRGDIVYDVGAFVQTCLGHSG